jgi:hypothetical protein
MNRLPAGESPEKLRFSSLRNNRLRLPSGAAIRFPGGTCTRWGPVPFTAHCYANYRKQPPSASAAGLTVNLAEISL